MTCAIIRVVMNHSQEWLRKKGKKVTCLEPVILQMIRKDDASEEGKDNMISVERLIIGRSKILVMFFNRFTTFF